MKDFSDDQVIMRRICEEGGISYTYELIKREGARTDDWRLTLYSFRILMRDSDGNVSQRMARDVFTELERAEEFFDMLVKNLATPIDLSYVIEDEVRI